SRDSIGFDSSHNLFYDTYYFYPQFRIDTNLNIFEAPQEGWNFLLYKLDADVGDIWEGKNDGISWAWVTRIETAYVFSKLTTIKIFRYGPGRPDSANSPGFLENWLASGFGLIYSDYNYGFTYLQGCIIAGDTFGIVTSVKDILTEIPEVFKLNQNYPNPFNPTTTIEFELAHEAEVNIHVYDILGQQITILSSGFKPAGIHKIKWNASGLTSGVYLCRLQANDKVSSIKMLLTR
ncbi:MAG: T9SS type A sorting domain-containing protein, partial [Ignavibacteriaceae bacterium]|nr:T9SS type A sorting domain-containing protein [Ignavibacteriaceae bacterium]